MSEMDITQAEADVLIAMEKHRVDDRTRDFPMLGGCIAVPLLSADKLEAFILDVRRGRIDLLRGTYQNRGRQVVVLLRLDVGGQPHCNPDGQDVPTPHLHIYREGYGDKWAMPLPREAFPNASDLYQTLRNFMVYCNVTRQPVINGGLQS
jgi:hypothetical protein